MAYFDPDDAQGSVSLDAFRNDDASVRLPLPSGAQRTLDEIADALGVTEALLRRPADAALSSESARLAEASELLRAFIQIKDPAARRRCIALVQQLAAASAQAPSA